MLLTVLLVIATAGTVVYVVEAALFPRRRRSRREQPADWASQTLDDIRSLPETRGR